MGGDNFFNMQNAREKRGSECRAVNFREIALFAKNQRKSKRGTGRGTGGTETKDSHSERVLRKPWGGQ